MQLSGLKCLACGQSILVQTEGTWCARCRGVYHADCVTSGTVCPQCHQVIDPPEAYFAYSQLCPECFAPNLPPQAACTRCGAITRWDTHADYEAFCGEVDEASKRSLLHGIAKLVLAVLCAGIVLFFIWFKIWVSIFMFAMIAGGFLAAYHGARDLRDWTDTRRFQ